MMIIACIAMLILVLTNAFIYVPALRKIDALNSELSAMQSQIEQIEAAVGRERSIAAGIELLKNRYGQLDMKFPSKEEDALRSISELARERNIAIITMKSQPKVQFLDAENKNVEIDGKICQILPVAIEMKSGYKDLGQYIETLKKSLPAYVTIERLKIQKESGAALDLKVTLELNLYLLS